MPWCWAWKCAAVQTSRRRQKTVLPLIPLIHLQRDLWVFLIVQGDENTFLGSLFRAAFQPPPTASFMPSREKASGETELSPASC